MTNLLFVSGIPQMGGTEAVMGNIYQMIDSTRFHIDFMFFGKPEEDDSSFSKDVSKRSQIYYIPLLRNGIRENHLAIEKVLKEHPYDIIHTHMDASGTDVLRIAKKCGVRVRIAHSHNTNIAHLENAQTLKGKLHKQYIDWQKSRITKYATHYIACSFKAGEWLFGKAVCQQDNFMVFRNAIDVDRYVFNSEIRKQFRDKYRLNGKKVIGHVGRFDYQKNHPYLIDVFSKVHKRDSSTELILIGSGEDMPKVKKQVKDLGLEEHIHFLGNQSNVNEWLQCFDLFVMPSYFEGLSVVSVEAQASGLPCLTSTAVTKESDISGLVEFMDITLKPDIWAEKVVQMLGQKRTRISPIEAICRNGFDLKTNIKDLEIFYSKCTGDKCGYIRE